MNLLKALFGYLTLLPLLFTQAEEAVPALEVGHGASVSAPTSLFGHHYSSVAITFSPVSAPTQPVPAPGKQPAENILAHAVQIGTLAFQLALKGAGALVAAESGAPFSLDAQNVGIYGYRQNISIVGTP